jgi:VCBS repeat-containing protein
MPASAAPGAAAPAGTYPVGPPLPPGYTPPAATPAPELGSPVASAQAEVRDAMDPNAVRSDLVNGPPGSGGQQSAGEAGLAGSWQVVCATSGGQPHWYDPGAWEVRLGQDGSAVITRQDSGRAWEQRGTWEASAGSLSLHLGPGGEHTYTVAGDDPDVQVLAEAESQTALFVLRLQSGAPVPQLYQRYTTDFGPLSFTPAGPGRWSGSYGQPAGKLTVRMRGSFSTGIWEQSPNHGGVILRLTPGGFTGWWWYDGSLRFDGRWDGNKGG